MPKSQRYEDINVHTPSAETLNLDYKAHCIGGRRSFIGNIRYWDGNKYNYYNDRMVVSPINALDTFPYPDNILDLDVSDGDEIIALKSIGDKIVQLKTKIVYILNISTGIASEFLLKIDLNGLEYNLLIGFVKYKMEYFGLMKEGHGLMMEQK